jgi:hypothetical protein
VLQVPQWLASLATQASPQQSWPLPQLLPLQTQVPLAVQGEVAPGLAKGHQRHASRG